MIIKQPDRERAIREAIENNVMAITCPNCASEHMLEQVSKKYELAEHKGTFEVGIECPDCNLWTHSFFVNARLAGLRRELDKAAALVSAMSHIQMPDQKRLEMSDRLEKQYRKKKRSFATAFNAFNDMMRNKYDITTHPDERQSSGQYHTA